MTSDENFRRLFEARTVPERPSDLRPTAEDLRRRLATRTPWEIRALVDEAEGRRRVAEVPEPPARTTPSADLPRHRTIMAVDIENSTMHSNSVRAWFRDLLFRFLDEAFATAEIGRRHREPFIDRGDGALCLIRPFDQLPKTLLLTTVVPALHDLLEKHAEDQPELAFRVRVAVHAGEVHHDLRGPYGEDVDIACRLVDAPELKRQLRETTAPLVLAVSQEVYRSVVRHGYPGIDRDAFSRIVHIKLGGERLRGWLHTPEAESHAEGNTA
jgi:class 3 adenylate cyclase